MRADRLHIGRVLVHGAASAKRVGQGAEVVASSCRIGGVKGLLVGSGAGRRAAEGALARDDDIHVAALQLDCCAQPRRAAAKDKGFGAVHRQDIASDRHQFLRWTLVGQPWHRDVGQAIEDRLGDDRAQRRFREVWS